MHAISDGTEPLCPPDRPICRNLRAVKVETTVEGRNRPVFPEEGTAGGKIDSACASNVGRHSVASCPLPSHKKTPNLSMARRL